MKVDFKKTLPTYKARKGRFDLIVANPPYLASAEMQDVAPELRDHEPEIALTDGQDGLTAYRIIAEEAQGYLTANGRVMVEIGWQQGVAVCDIFRRSGWARVELAHDLDGRPRVVSAGEPA